jgi:DNA repair protein RadC
MKFKELSHSDKPREKILNFGPESLSESELIAILLNTGIKDKNVLEVSRELLSYFNNSLILLYQGLLSYIENIKENKPQSPVFKGLGPAKVAKLIAALEIAKRMEQAKYPIINEAFSSPEVVVKHFRAELRKEPIEQFIVVLLNRQNVMIDKRKFGDASIASVHISLREVFKYAVQKNAASMILIHNHPSNNIKPSDADIQITNKIRNIAKELEIDLLDHLIITHDSYFSFAEKIF